MSTVSLKNASLSGAVKYNSLLAGNVAFEPITGTFDLLETTTLASSASSVTFSGLDSYTDYKHLQIRMVVRSTRSGFTADTIFCYVNSDVGTNYSRHRIRGDGSSVSSSASSSDSSGLSPALASAASSGTGEFGVGIMDLLDFSDTSKNTTARALRGVVGGVDLIDLGSGAWINTAAVTSLEFYASNGNLDTGSRFSLYGWKG